MVQSYIGDYWNGQHNGYDRILYKLSEPSDVNSQYLLRGACIEIKELIAGALTLCKRSGEVDMDYMNIIERVRRLLKKMLDEAVIDTDPRVIVCRIPGILNNLMAIAHSVDEEELPPHFLASARNLYHTYVLGVVDICCTMDGGSTVIDQNYNVEPQLYHMARRIDKYPHLLDWVQQSTQDWERGRLMDSRLRFDRRCIGFESKVWYLTSPTRGSPLHFLDTYHKHGHAHT